MLNPTATRVRVCSNVARAASIVLLPLFSAGLWVGIELANASIVQDGQARALAADASRAPAGSRQAEQPQSPAAGRGSRSCEISLDGLVGAMESPATTNTYELWGTLNISSPPASGELYVRVPGGPSQVFTAPFDPVLTVQVQGLYADGATRTVTASFTDDPACSDSVSFQAPEGAGTLFVQDTVLSNVTTLGGSLFQPNWAGANLTDFFVAGLSNNTAAVRIPVNISSLSLSNYTTFCVELGETVSQSASYDDIFSIQPLEFSSRGTSGSAQGILRPAGGVGRVKAGMIRWLFDNHFAGTGTQASNTQAAAFQTALWTITHDHFSPATANHSVVAVTTQGTYLTSANNGVRADAQAMLDGINTLGWTAAQWESYVSQNWHPVLLENLGPTPGSGIQDLITAVPLTSSEDFGFDWGDLPTGYPTLAADNGARHVITGVNDAFLGVFRPDSEANGQPNATATGDDAEYVNDEDGVELWTEDWDFSAASPQQSIWFRVTIGNPGFLSLYIDPDSSTTPTLTRATLANSVDGPASVTVPAGTENFGDIHFSEPGQYFVEIIIPAGAAGQSIATRWRITNNANEGGNSATGQAASGEVEDHIFQSGTGVPVTLAWFESQLERGELVVRWATASELGNVGFNVFAEDGRRDWSDVVGSMVASEVIDSVEPQFYEWRGRAGDVKRLFLEDVDVFGRGKLHGPFEIGQRYGEAPQIERIDWQGIQAARDARSARRASDWPGLGQAPVRLLVENDGIYRVGFDQLASAGLISGPVKSSYLELHADGETVPMRVISRSPDYFGPGDQIEFLGRAHRSLYSDARVYKLKKHFSVAQSGSKGGTAPGFSPGFAESRLTKTHMETVRIGRDAVYNFRSPTGSPFADTRMVVTNSPRERHFDFWVDQLDGVGSGAQLLVSLTGGTDWPGVSPDHHVEVRLNGRLLADEWFTGTVQRLVQVAIPERLLENGTNRLSLRMPADTGAGADVVFLDYFEVTFPRKLAAQRGELAYEGAASAFQVTGLHTNEPVIYREASGVIERVEPLRVSGTGPFTAIIPGNRDGASYWIQSTGHFMAPEIEPGRPRQDIVNGHADYLMIVHPDFIDGIQPLVAHHQGQGLEVRVVDVRDIYDQFSHGRVDAEAIQAYIRATEDTMGYQHVLLVGGDTRDYRNTLGSNSISFIPSLYAETGPYVLFAPADALFVDLNDDGVPDLPIGRLPVRTPEELAAVVDKTLIYAQGRGQRSAVIAADRQDPAVSFSQQANRLVAPMQSDWSVSRAFIDDLGVDGARQALISQINSGASLTAYLGHSAFSVWSFDSLLTGEDVSQLANYGQPTVVAQWGCWNTYHVGEAYNTMGHEFILGNNRGAALVMGPSTFSQSQSGARFGEFLMPLLSDGGERTIGEAVQQAKREVLAEGLADPRDVLLGWTILGDPALRLP